jgi:NAD(P)-dependent dehydrogenase (short-subunit alcohol dehydrogenase family)
MTSYPEITLPGAVVVVTGAARGIGLATATHFAARGARVVIADLTLDAAMDAARSLGSGVSAYQLDAGSRASFQQLVDAVETEIGPIEVLVNNAGIMPVGPVLDEREATAVAQFNVNFWAHYHAVRIVTPLMARRGRGHIVNVSSGAGMIPVAGMATYVASKHAATGFARSVREELADSGVSVTAVLPAAVRTQLTDGIPITAWERPFVIRPSWVARTIVGTLRHRRAVVGAPPGLVTALRLMALMPDPMSHLVRKLALGRLMGPIDAQLRAEYDSRIALQSAPGRPAVAVDTVK